MYNPRDYAAKREQVRRQRRTIVIMIAVMAAMMAGYVIQCRDADSAVADAWEWRERMWTAQDRCDSLEQVIGTLEGRMALEGISE